MRFNACHRLQHSPALAAMMSVAMMLVAIALLAARAAQPDDLTCGRLMIVAPDGRPAAQLTVDAEGAAHLTALTAEGSHAASIAANGQAFVLRLGEGESQKSLSLDARALELLSALLASGEAPVTPENLAITVAALKQTSQSIEKDQLRLAGELTELQRTLTMTGDEGRQGTLLRELSDLQREQQRETLRISQLLEEVNRQLDRLDRDVRDLQRRVR